MKKPIPPPNNNHTNDLIARGYPIVAGVDEVGRGAWAGPVVAAAVILTPNTILEGARDSKLMSLAQRHYSGPQIKRKALAVGIGWSSPLEIDLHGLTWAVATSAERALQSLGCSFDAVILDGKHNYLSQHYFTETIVKADQTCLNVAAASIIAKVARDNYMRYQARLWPQYGFATNVGYGTGQHQIALQGGLTPLHRRLFKPIQKLSEAQSVN